MNSRVYEIKKKMRVRASHPGELLTHFMLRTQRF